MKTSEISSSSNLRILRNGKIVIPSKNALIKKTSVMKMKINNQLFFPKTRQKDLSTLHNKNKNDSHEIMVTTAYDHLFDNRSLYILLEKLSWPVINNIKVTLDDQNNNNSNKNCYKNLENYIQLNELQIYNELEPKKGQLQLDSTEKTIQTALPLNSLSKKNSVRTDSNSVTNQNIDVRITRGKTMKLQMEERKQLDQIMFSKFPNNTFNKMFVIKLDDISEEAKFLSTLGLTCRFKCPLTTCKFKKKH